MGGLEDLVMTPTVTHLRANFVFYCFVGSFTAIDRQLVAALSISALLLEANTTKLSLW